MLTVLQHIRNKYTNFQLILFAGIFIRLVAAIFSKGFGWFDDHFLVIEAAQSWVDGFDYNFWLPDEALPDRHAQGHPLFYVGIHYYLLKFFSALGMSDPQFKMLLIRILHAFYSMLTVIYGYKLAKKLCDEKTALTVAALLSLFWFMPFLSVRNLVEFVCVPPLIMASYFFISKKNNKEFFIGGVLLGLAFSIRFQSLFYSAGIVLALFINKNSIRNLLSALLGFILIVVLTQGLIDYVIWKRPFAEFMAYFSYNIENATIYGNNIWHMYFDLIFGLLIPPLSFVLFAGWIYDFKRIPILFLPVLFYLLFHTLFPNKQERFVVTLLPGIIIAGVIGFDALLKKYPQFFSVKLFRYSIVFAVIVNFILLPIASLTYSKRNRCEALYFLRNTPDAIMPLIEDSNKENDFTMPPLFYFGKWHSVIGITKTFTTDSAVVAYNLLPEQAKPNYAIFWRAENMNNRVNSLRKKFLDINYVTTIEPGFIDKILNRLNPLNDNETAYIYTLGSPIKQNGHEK